MYVSLYVILMRYVSCLTVVTVHFTNVQVALIFFFFVGFLLLSLTFLILCPYVLRFTRFLSLGNMLYWC